MTSPNEPCSDMSAGGRAKGAKGAREGATTKKTGYNNKREGRELSLKDEWRDGREGGSRADQIPRRLCGLCIASV